MHTYHWTGQSVADLCDGKAGCVGCKNALWLCNLIQLLECSLLNAHILESRLYDEVTILAKVFL